jgi:uncharacterized protein (TIGR03067 family)
MLTAINKGEITMKKMDCFTAVALVVTTVLMCGCNSTDDTPISDMEKLQGTWVGNELGLDGEARIVFSGDTIDFKGAHPQEWYKGIAVINAEMTPRQADFTISECAMPDYIGKIAKAIYKLEESTLTLAGSEPGDESRPTSFDPSRGIRVFQFELKPEATVLGQ